MSASVIDVYETDLAEEPKLDVPAKKVTSVRTSRNRSAVSKSTRAAGTTKAAVTKAAVTKAAVTKAGTAKAGTAKAAPTKTKTPSTASRTIGRAKNTERLEATPGTGDLVTKAIEDLSIGVGAIERIAIAKLDALIEKLQVVEIDDDAHIDAEYVAIETVEVELVAEVEVITEAEILAQPDVIVEAQVVLEVVPRGGRHISDEVTFSIHSFVAGRVPRHRVETASDLMGIAS